MEWQDEAETRASVSENAESFEHFSVVGELDLDLAISQRSGGLTVRSERREEERDDPQTPGGREMRHGQAPAPDAGIQVVLVPGIALDHDSVAGFLLFKGELLALLVLPFQVGRRQVGSGRLLAGNHAAHRSPAKTHSAIVP